MSSGLRGPRKEYRGYETCTCQHCKPRSITGRKWWKKLAHKKSRKNADKQIREGLE